MSDPLPELPLVLAGVPATLRQALEQEGVPCDDQRSRRSGRFVLFDSKRGQPSLDRDQIGIDVDHLRRGRSRDPFKALGDERAACCEWRVGRLQVRETAAQVNRAAVREQVLSDLRIMIESAGGVWLRLAPFPYPYRTAFNFRIDHDEYDAHDFNATLAAIAGYEHAVSHYVCAATHAGHHEALARLKDAHVGSHGWWHHTYRETADNLMNIGRGTDSLRAAGLDPVGFAAPHGRFNRGLLAALEQLGVTHSSEFSLAYDDLPFFPCQSNVLQIPIHPICLGICLDAARRSPGRTIGDGAAAGTMLEHWRAVASRKHSAGEPIFLYGHPDGRLGRFPELLRTALAMVIALPDVWSTTLAAFELWWRARSRVRLSVVRRGETIEVTSHGLSAGYRFAIEYVRGNETALVELDRSTLSFSADALSWRRRHPRQPTMPAPSLFAPGLRAGLRSCLDWENVTPIHEINARTWRGWAKRTLRRIRT